MSSTLVQPYLFFGGRCEEALEFYRTALGAQVEMLMLYKDSPEPQPPGMLPPGFENKVMHTTFRIGGSTLTDARKVRASEGFRYRSPCLRKLSLTEPSPRLPKVDKCRCH